MCTPYDGCEHACLVPPLVSPRNPVAGYCSEAPLCTPCLPPCPKTILYYCPVKTEHHRERKDYDYRDRRDDCCYERHDRHDRHDRCDRHERHDRDRCEHCGRHDGDRRRDHDDTYNYRDIAQKDCCVPIRTVRTKYIVPCYRYEDGRIVQQERYVPTRHGTLPISAYRRNGMQDQIHGYRGAQRYLCACEESDGNFVHTVVEPIRRFYYHITDEVFPVKRKKEKK